MKLLQAANYVTCKVAKVLVII